MTNELLRVVDRFADVSVVVIGESMLDAYLDGSAGRICREAPVPIVSLGGRRDAPGGAANTAVNAAVLGARVRFLSAVGDDREARLLRRALLERGVPSDDVLTDRSRETLAKNRVVADGQILLRFDQGTTGPVSPRTEAELLSRLQDAWRGADAVLVSDYGYGILTPNVIDALRRLQASSPRVLIVDAKHPERFRDVGVTASKPNFAEAARLVGLGDVGDRADAVIAHADVLRTLTGSRMIVVTLDTDGAVLLEADRPPYRTYARPSVSSRAAGAGDTFAATLTVSLGAGADAVTAVELASAAASVVVQADGTTSCSARQLARRLVSPDRVVPDHDTAAALAQGYRADGRAIVFTNGCFDILHRGHVAYLNQAKALGDVLIVGLNSDESVRRLKGRERPINRLEDRAQVLAALSCVDHIVPFEEDTPVALIERIRPDVYVKGGDYAAEMLPEREVVERIGGRVQILGYVHDASTSGIIEQIRAAG